MSGIFVIVDDQDPSIHYSTGWSPLPSENEFQFAGTMTVPAGLGSVGSTATYEFEGTSISVFGLTRADASKPNMTMDFEIDGIFQSTAVIQPHAFEAFHFQFFESSQLPAGPHTLQITISSINTTNVLLDYLIYEASPNAPLNGAAQILVPNTSPQLAYSDGWSTGITGLRSGLTEKAITLNTTVEAASDLGSTVALNFTGSGLEVRGLLVQQFPSPVAAYSIDSGTWEPVQMPPNGSSYFNAQTNFEFIGQRFESVGNHSLVITPLIPGAFFLDFITVQGPTAVFPLKANVAPPPSLGGSASATSTGNPLPPATSASEALASHGLRAGVIAGICITIAVCLSVVALTAFLLSRRRQRQRGIITDQFDTSMETRRADTRNRGVTPFAPTRSGSSGGSNPGMDRKKTGIRGEPIGRADEQGTGGIMTGPPAYTE
ncbi:hypothetical protein C8R45DRAFT_1096566 [Mycena sanguinolenta]|nr:hypothetical protein C8R45DRAFT_1096566 [Mycena sanguinolenta]